MAQFLRPDSNVTQTNFTNGFANIDEATASDADFAYGANNTVAVLEVGLGNPSATPGSGTTTVRYRIAKTNAGTVDGGGNAVTVTGAVYQGTSLISSDSARTATGTWTEYSWTPDMSGVTDWNDVRLRFTTSQSGGSPANRRGGAVSWAELEAPDGASAQDITGVLVTDDDTFYGATAQAVYALTGALVTDDDTFFGATLSPGAVTVSAELVSNSETFFGATIVPEAMTIAAELVTDGDTFYAATAQALYTLTAALVSNSQTFEAAEVVPGAVSIGGVLVENSQTFFGATIGTASSPQDIDAALVVNAETFFGAAIVAGAVSITGALVSDDDTFFGSTVTPGAVTILAALYQNDQTFYNASIDDGSSVASFILAGIRRRRR